MRIRHALVCLLAFFGAIVCRYSTTAGLYHRAEYPHFAFATGAGKCGIFTDAGHSLPAATSGDGCIDGRVVAFACGRIKHPPLGIKWRSNGGARKKKAMKYQ
jgi:hypothetical protein